MKQSSVPVYIGDNSEILLGTNRTEAPTLGFRCDLDELHDAK
jgi:hypothetical protein